MKTIRAFVMVSCCFLLADAMPSCGKKKRPQPPPASQTSVAPVINPTVS